MTGKWDVVIVLGAGINEDGSLPEAPKAWVRKGAELIENSVAPNLLMSGAYSFWLENPPPRTEAEAMKDYALGLGVSENVVFIEEKSKDTIGNAYFSKIEFLEPRRWNKVLIICSNYRRKRTRYLFEKVLGNGYEISFADEPSEDARADMTKLLEREEKSLEVSKEWLDPITNGDDEKIKKALYTKHPGYAENPEFSKEKLSVLLDRKRLG